MQNIHIQKREGSRWDTIVKQNSKHQMRQMKNSELKIWMTATAGWLIVKAYARDPTKYSTSMRLRMQQTPQYNQNAIANSQLTRILNAHFIIDEHELRNKLMRSIEDRTDSNQKYLDSLTSVIWKMSWLEHDLIDSA